MWVSESKKYDIIMGIREVDEEEWTGHIWLRVGFTGSIKEKARSAELLSASEVRLYSIESLIAVKLAKILGASWVSTMSRHWVLSEW
jgi:hypothetical protein